MSHNPDPEHTVAPLVADGTPGQLITARGNQLPVRVAQRAGDVILLVLMLRPGAELSATDARPARLEYTTPRGLMRLKGRALLQDRDLIRFDVVEEPDVLQRRDFVRVPVAQPVKVRVGESSEILDAYALDISGGGMLLRAPCRLEIDDQIHFTLEIGSDKGPIKGSARVVRAPGGDLRGVAFEQLADRERLIRFIFERQRAELMLRRERVRKNLGAR